MKTLYVNTYRFPDMENDDADKFMSFCRDWADENGYIVREYCSLNEYSETSNLDENETDDAAENLWEEFCRLN